MTEVAKNMSKLIFYLLFLGSQTKASIRHAPTGVTFEINTRATQLAKKKVRYS